MLYLLLLLFLQTLTLPLSLHHSHQFWLTASKATIRLTDRAWNYCDQKCLYLQHYSKHSDFVVIYFKDTTFKPSFAACYVKKKEGGYELWNTRVNNEFFEKLCGMDKDWLALGKYEVVRVEGEGIGNGLKK